MVDTAEELKPYKAYFVPFGAMPAQMAEMLAKIVTMFYVDGYSLIETHDLLKQEMTVLIFKLERTG